MPLTHTGDANVINWEPNPAQAVPLPGCMSNITYFPAKFFFVYVLRRDSQQARASIDEAN